MKRPENRASAVPAYGAPPLPDGTGTDGEPSGTGYTLAPATEAFPTRALENLHLLQQVFVGGVRRQPRLWPEPLPEPELRLAGEGWEPDGAGGLRWSQAIPSIGRTLLPLPAENTTQDTLTAWAEASPPLRTRWPNGSPETVIPPAHRPVTLALEYDGKGPREGTLDSEISLALTHASGVQRLRTVPVRVALRMDFPFLEIDGFPGEIPDEHHFGEVNPLKGSGVWELKIRNRGQRELTLAFAGLPRWVWISGRHVEADELERPALRLSPGGTLDLQVLALADLRLISAGPDLPMGPRNAPVRLITNDIRAREGELPLFLRCVYRIDTPCVELAPAAPVRVSEDGTARMACRVLNLGSMPAWLELDEITSPGVSAPPCIVPRATADGAPGRARWVITWRIASETPREERLTLPWRLTPLASVVAELALGEHIPAIPEAGVDEFPEAEDEDDTGSDVVLGPFTPEDTAPLLLTWDWQRILRDGEAKVAVTAREDEGPAELSVMGPMLGHRLAAEPPEIRDDCALSREEVSVGVMLRNTGTERIDVTAIDSDQPWLNVFSPLPAFTLLPPGAGPAAPEGDVFTSSYILTLSYLPESLPEGPCSASVTVRTSRPGLSLQVPVRLVVRRPAGSHPGHLGLVLESDNPDVPRWATFSGTAVAAVWDPADPRPALIPEGGTDGPKSIPQWITLRGEGARVFTIGTPAKNVAQVYPEHSASTAALMSMLGTPDTRKIEGKDYRADELIGLFLRRIARWAERFLFERAGRSRYLAVDKAVLVVSADFNPDQARGAVKVLAAAGLAKEDRAARTGGDEPPSVLYQPEAEAVYLHHILGEDGALRDRFAAKLAAGRPVNALAYRMGPNHFTAYLVQFQDEKGTVHVEPRHTVCGRELGTESMKMMVLLRALQECRKRHPDFADDLIACPDGDLVSRGRSEGWLSYIFGPILHARNHWIEAVETLLVNLHDHHRAKLDVPPYCLISVKKGNVVMSGSSFTWDCTRPSLIQSIERPLERCLALVLTTLDRGLLAADDVDFVFRGAMPSSVLSEELTRRIAALFSSKPLFVDEPDPPGAAAAEGAVRHAQAVGRSLRGYRLQSNCRNPWTRFGDCWDLSGMKTQTPWFLGERSSGVFALENRTEKPLRVQVGRRGPGVTLDLAGPLEIPPESQRVVPFRLHFDPAFCSPGPFRTFVELEADLPSQRNLAVPIEGHVVRAAGRACPQCRKIDDSGARECRMCGYPLADARPLPPEDVLACPKCGLRFAAPAQFCPRDGVTLVPPVPTKP